MEGASDDVLTQYSRDRAAARIRRERLQKEVAVVKKNLRTDSLTGVLNVEGFNQVLTFATERAQREGQPVTLAILDANKLKELNDTQGHEAGDKYLKKIAGVLTQTARTSDVLGLELGEAGNQDQEIVARWGGDEFGLVLFDTNLEGARVWWERAEKQFTQEGISISVGAQVIEPGEIQGTKEERQNLIAQKRKEADKAMYRAKQEGAGKNAFRTFPQIQTKG